MQIEFLRNRWIESLVFLEKESIVNLVFLKPLDLRCDLYMFYGLKNSFFTNFSRNCWKTRCIKTLQFLFQMFTFFNPISNKLGTWKLNCISYLFKFCYRQILRITKAGHEVIILYEFGKWKWMKKIRQKQPFTDVFQIRVSENFALFTGKHRSVECVESLSNKG